LYSGTNPIEATKTSQAFLKYLSTFKNVNFILTTHYNSICKKLQEDGRIKNCKTIVSRNEETDEFIYTYKIKNGICNIFGAKEVLKKMNYCNEILELL
jgi:DNA mismatch repair ATPase MutS